MNQQKLRRKQIALRSFAYGVMTLAVFAGAALCLAWAMGFRFDFGSGQISQVALLQFNSFPTGATVDVNNKKLSGSTPNRVNINSGQIKVKMSKDNYRDWSKTITAAPSSVRWLNYTRFVPQNVKSESVRNFAAVEQMTTSPDKKFILINTSVNTRDFWLANIDNPEKILWTNLSLDAAKISAPAENESEKFEIVEWDLGSRYVLIAHKIGEMTEYLEIDTQKLQDLTSENNNINAENNSTENQTAQNSANNTNNANNSANSNQNSANAAADFAKKQAATKNLTRDFNLQIADPHFSGTSGEVFFALVGGDLRKFDYGSNSISAPLAQNVQNYRPYGGGKLTFVQAAEKTENCPPCPENAVCDSCQIKKIVSQNVGIYDDGREKIAKSFDENLPTSAEFAEYNNIDYLAILRDKTVEVYANALDEKNLKKVDSLSVNGEINLFEFSPNGRFVVVASENKIASFDIETGEKYSFELAEKPQKFVWLDDFHLLDNSEKSVAMIEFDGENRERIVSGRGAATLSDDGKYLFSLDDVAGGGVILQRSKMVLE